MEVSTPLATETAVEPHRGRGRPATITLDVVERVARLIAKGMTEEQACVRAWILERRHGSQFRNKSSLELVDNRDLEQMTDEELMRIARGEPYEGQDAIDCPATPPLLLEKSGI